MTTTAPSHKTPSAAPDKVRVEFMPGRVLELEIPAGTQVPKYVVARIVKQPNNTYAMIPLQLNTHVRLTQKLPREMGIPCDRRIIYNLIRAGLVKGTMISPRNLMVDLGSLFDHIQRCQVGAGKPVYWTKGRIEKYQFASIGAAAECDEDDFRLE